MSLDDVIADTPLSFHHSNYAYYPKIKLSLQKNSLQQACSSSQHAEIHKARYGHFLTNISTLTFI